KRQRELLRLARRYELRADQLNRRSRQGQSEIVTAARRWIISLSLAWLSSSALAADLSGTARVIDGDTIVIGDTHIRLWGIDAPERQQTCRSKTGDVYECGRDSAAVLRELTRDRAIQCQARDRDQYGRVVAVCRTESSELTAAMVRRGWAVDSPKTATGDTGRRKSRPAANSSGSGPAVSRCPRSGGIGINEEPPTVDMAPIRSHRSR